MIPFLPKSTRKLSPGDCCFIPRKDGKYVPFVFVFARHGKRSDFYGALLDETVESPDVGSVSKRRKVRYHALSHISCFAENDTPIVGNVAKKLALLEFWKVRRASLSTKVGAKQSVWGYKTIIKYANLIESS